MRLAPCGFRAGDAPWAGSRAAQWLIQEATPAQALDERFAAERSGPRLSGLCSLLQQGLVWEVRSEPERLLGWAFWQGLVLPPHQVAQQLARGGRRPAW